MKQIDLPLYKFYLIEGMTQEDLNELALERNNLLEEVYRLNNIINELEKCIKNKYYEAIDYQAKIRQSDLMQGDYPVKYYLAEQNEQLCNYFLNRLKDLQELKRK